MKRVGGMEIVMGMEIRIEMVTMETEMGMETGMETGMEMEIQDGYNLDHG